jgi:hypothetical protein
MMNQGHILLGAKSDVHFVKFDQLVRRLKCGGILLLEKGCRLERDISQYSANIT